jgi:hypothetical protein
VFRLVSFPSLPSSAVFPYLLSSSFSLLFGIPYFPGDRSRSYLFRWDDAIILQALGRVKAPLGRFTFVD